jgi:hypothetical protein
MTQELEGAVSGSSGARHGFAGIHTNLRKLLEVLRKNQTVVKRSKLQFFKPCP